MALLLNKKITRESNIELLRIVLMLMIIGYHLIVHGAKMGGPKLGYYIFNESSIVYIFLKSFLVISVNCFVFISGFYRINFKIYPFLSLIFQTIFYSVGITFVIDMLSLEYVSLNQYLKALIPVFTGTWWFITAYLALYLLSPLLNSAIDSFNRNQFLFILISLTLINTVSGFFIGTASIVGSNRGYSLLSFIHIYLIAQFIRKYVHLEKLTKYSPAVYIASSLLVFLLTLLSITELDHLGIKKIYAYNNPLVLIAAISFFFFFKSINIRSGLINSISPYVLGVYLFHDHPLTRKYLIENLFNLSQSSSAYLHFLGLLLITFLVFFAGYLIDRVRQLLLAPFTHYLIRRFNLVRIDRIFLVRPN